MRSLDTDLPLTPHQRSMIRLLWGGLTTREIAAASGVSYWTAHGALAEVYRKLGVDGWGSPRTRAAVWLYAQEYGHGGTDI